MAPALAPQSYIINSGNDVFGAHVPFTVETSPVADHKLCGDLSFIANFNDAPVDGDPLTYNADKS